MQPFEQLESEWAKFNDLDPAGMVACSSGTAALHLALEALQLPLGSEVLVPDFSMIACPRAVTLAGLTPVFVDCDDTLNMDLSCYRRALLPDNVRATMLVHVYGRRVSWMNVFNGAGCRADEIDKQPHFLIEDLAEAHGVRPHPHTDAACWSFYKNKIVAGEEGGTVYFRDPKHAALARQLRSLGFTDAHDFWHVPRGHNYRMSNLHAEAILGESDTPWFMNSLHRYHDLTATILHRDILRLGNASLRREIEGWYDKHCPNEWRMPPRDAVWVYDLRIPRRDSWNPDAYKRQDRVVRALNDAGIAARHSFKPCHLQEEYKGCRFVFSGGPGIGSLEGSVEVMYLPVLPGRTTEEDCRLAMQIIRDVIGLS